jgi:predicted double-glycine peptidase
MNLKWIVMGTLFLVGIATTALAKDPQLPGNFLRVPLVRQATEYSCGPASLEAILFYWKVSDTGEQALYGLLKTTKEKGTEPLELADGAKHFGLDANYRTNLTINDIREYLDNGFTVILNIQAWPEEYEKPKDGKVIWKDMWKNGHYIVLVGMDEEYAYFMDPSVASGYGYLTLPGLSERWHDLVGADEKTYGIGIAIRGKEHLQTVPGPLAPIE